MAEASTVAPVKQLFAADGPLVWVDCEMTGLNPGKDKLLEIAVIITDGDLERVDDGINLIIHREKDVLDNMDSWCIKQHGQTGLTQACLESPHSVESVASQILSYIKQRIPKEKVAYLAGSSVHFDRAFLSQEMSEVVDWLHYRIVDVSTIKVLANRWCPQHRHTHEESDHRALSDILGSIQELRTYREKIFLNTNNREVKEEETEEGRGTKRSVTSAMDFNDYYNIDAILTENQKIQCKFKQRIPDMGHLGTGMERDIMPNSKLQLPVWLSYIVLYSDWADLVMPMPFAPRIYSALKAESRSVQLASLMGAGASWYMLGRIIMDILQGGRAQELSTMMTETFKARLTEVIDQSQHFANLGPSVGRSDSSAQVFREGLDVTERELFTLARDSAKATKLWYDG
ncbi:hypothetical protein AX14_010484 [Amanita brunnescens Koide BX004]|nr:hypothetical protein AX14_010484 [Amanita brunnescens Koide BX004]